MNNNKSKTRELWDAIKGDGCTDAPDFAYTACCNDHDRRYTTGTDRDGNPITRAESDTLLRECMEKAGKTPIIGKFILPWTYWLGVRLFAASHFKQP